MAINFNNRNQGIGALNLGDFGLQQPEENMTVAEAINFGTLPQAQDTFTPEFPMGAKMNLGVKEFMKNNPTPTKASFIEALESGNFGGATGGMFDKNVGTLFEGVPLDASLFSTEVGDVNPQFISPKGSFGGTIDIRKDQLSNPEDLPAGFFKGVGDQSSLGLPTNDKLAMAISNYDDLFGPQTMTDAFGTTRSISGSQRPDMYTGVMDQSGNPIMDDIDMQYTDESFNVQPQYRIRDQLKRDFLEGGLFRDAKQSLGQTKDAFLEDLSGLRNMIGSGINNAKEGIMNSSPMNFLRGLPTPGNLLLNMAATRNPLNPRASNYNPTLQGQIDYMKDKGMYGITDQSGLNKITGGRLAGKNLVSLFGSNDLGEMYGKDLSKLEGYLATMPQRFSRLMKTNPASYQKKVERLEAKIAQNKIEAQAAQAAREAATAARAMARNPEVYRNAGITSGGFASQNYGTNENFSNRTGRGRTGYSEGGLASMFTRRG